MKDYNKSAKTLYKAVGCKKCRKTGYKGRMVIAEILDIDRELDHMISMEASKKEMSEYVAKKGFITIQRDGVEKVLLGLTSIQELIRTVDMTESLIVKSAEK